MTRVPMSRRIRNKMKDICHNLSARLQGTEYYEKEWSAREYEKSYWDSIDHPHRNLLLSIISDFHPDSALEIGCNSGPNLFRIAKQFPSARLHGIDISSQAIEMGKKQLMEVSVSNVKLEVGKADDLSAFGDRSFDVVLTDAVLIYIGKDKIAQVINEMLRVARKAIVLVEWHDAKANPEGTFLMKKGYWVRDYNSLFKSRPEVADVRLKKITRDIWDDDCWSSYGHIIEVTLRNA